MARLMGGGLVQLRASPRLRPPRFVDRVSSSLLLSSRAQNKKKKKQKRRRQSEIEEKTHDGQETGKKKKKKKQQPDLLRLLGAKKLNADMRASSAGTRSRT